MYAVDKLTMSRWEYFLAFAAFIALLGRIGTDIGTILLAPRHLSNSTTVDEFNAILKQVGLEFGIPQGVFLTVVMLFVQEKLQAFLENKIK